MGRALIVVDVQNDFCEGGSLAVAGGTAVAGAISEHVRAAGDRYAHVVATRDHHVDPGGHFAEHPDFLESWPAHCVVGTEGVELHPALDRGPLEAVFDKGAYAAAYSGFEGRADGVPLADWLREHGVDAVDVVGIATDHCVRATALDAVGNGFATTVLLGLTAGSARRAPGPPWSSCAPRASRSTARCTAPDRARSAHSWPSGADGHECADLVPQNASRTSSRVKPSTCSTASR